MLQQENRWLWLLTISGVAAAAMLLCRQIGNHRRRRAERRRRAAAEFDRTYGQGNGLESHVEYRVVFADHQIDAGFLRELAIGGYDGTNDAVRIFPPGASPAEFSHETGYGGT